MSDGLSIGRTTDGDYLFITNKKIVVPMRVRMTVKSPLPQTTVKLLCGIQLDKKCGLIGGHACVIEQDNGFRIVSISSC